MTTPGPGTAGATAPVSPAAPTSGVPAPKPSSLDPNAPAWLLALKPDNKWWMIASVIIVIPCVGLLTCGLGYLAGVMIGVITGYGNVGPKRVISIILIALHLLSICCICGVILMEPLGDLLSFTEDQQYNWR
ncbi:MAG TPA: hypothetical protein VLA77_01245 [Candidatus Saccharimonadales bacterium]|nr:hypothetical protein [Candidatus Saccharimonadales bacterium]